MSPRKDMPLVVLFNPSPRLGFQAHRRVELPLNLLYPATPLVHAGFRVKLVDQFADPAWQTKLEEALREKPLCFGVSCMTGPQITRALSACKALKRRYPEVPTVWGGIHPTLLPQQTLQNPWVDVVVVGEGEATLLDLVRTLADGGALSTVAGIAYREGGSVCFTETRPFVDLNAQPPLSYELVDINHYRRKMFGSDHVAYCSSRGCPFRCSFCYGGVMHQRKYRAKQPERVVEELKRLIRDYDIHGFNFTDDNLFADMDHAHRLMEQILRADMRIKVGKLHIRIDTIRRMDDDFLDLVARVGIERLTIGVESGSQRVLDLIEKSLRVEHVLEASRKLVRWPFVPVYLFMMGVPTETPEEFQQSIQLAGQLLRENPKAAKSFNIYTPYPGTALYRLAVEMGMKEPQRLEDWPPLNYRNVPKEAPWLARGMKKLILGLDFPLMFLGTNFQFKKTHPIVNGLGKLYLPVARYRVRNMDVRFPFETKVVKALGLFGRQD